MVSIGIDFGTTYSRVAVYHEGRIDVIRNDFGSILTDSYVAFSKDGFLVGDEAKSQLTLNPTNTIFNMKRLVGRTSNDFMFQEDLKRLPYNVNQSYLKPKIKVMYKNKEKILIPEQVIAMILLKMKMIAEQYLNTLVKSAVISVPAYFNQLQRQAIIDAASIANLDIILINEPTAVAINYSLENNIEKAQNIMVFDLGGGKLDVSILTLFQEMITVKATVGDTNLGGEDFDNNMVDYFIERLPIDQKNSVLKDKRALQRMRIACEKAKRKLSTEKRVIVEIEPLFKKKYFFSPITQQEFETINADLFLKIMEIVKEAIRDSKINKYQIHEVIIVGGSSRIPKIQQLLQNLFNGKMLNKSLNLDLSTVIGAAMRSAMLNRNTQHLIPKLIIMDVMPFYVAIDRPNSIVTLIKKNSKIPTNYTFRLPYEISNLSDTNIITLKILNKRKTVRVDEQFILSGIPQVPYHIENPKFEITLHIDENGIISMNAIEEWTKFDKIIMADNKRFLTDNQINRMSRVTMQYLNNSDMEIEEEVENNNGMVWAFKRKLSNSNHRNSIKKLFTKENDEEIRESGRRMKMCNIL